MTIFFSSLIAYLTRNSESLGSQVEVWEKSRGSGNKRNKIKINKIIYTCIVHLFYNKVEGCPQAETLAAQLI